MIVIDAQHGLWDRQTLEHAVGLVSNRVPVLVRTAENSAISISHALDTGAEGVIVPLIENICFRNVVEYLGLGVGETD